MPLEPVFLTASPDTPASSLIKTQGRSAEIAAFEQSMAAFFVQAADLIGAPRSVAAIYSVLFASPEPLCFADIDARLLISNGSISHGLRLLKEIGAIRSVSYTGNRKEYFEPDMELKKMLTRFIEHRLLDELNVAERRLEIVKGAIPRISEHDAKLLESRVDQLAHWHAKAKALLPVAKTFLALV